jgi:CheY-like chemotaxis protein/signal transduction histidine kinase
MAANQKRLAEERFRADWLKSGLANLAQELRGDLDPATTARRAVASLARHLEAPAAAIYETQSDGSCLLLGEYAIGHDGGGLAASIAAGEGLVGQAAGEDGLLIINDPPADYLRIRSGLGEGVPRTLVLMAIRRGGAVRGVIELAFFRSLSEATRELLLAANETLAIALESARRRAEAARLLTETQELARRLAVQEEEVRAANDELQRQQEELRQVNEELGQQADELHAQRGALEERNAALDQTRKSLEQKNDELTTVSGYKSQFLTNMSHELRTPLNSMLLLSSLLSENLTRNLTDKQVEYCKTIHSGGRDLLALINQVLDLAKIEAGKQELHFLPASLSHLAERARAAFEPMARAKNLSFTVELASDLPATITTDSQRVEQVLTNLLGNAMKFTERGGLTLRIRRAPAEQTFRRADLVAASTVMLEVIDTGPGIAIENQHRVFGRFEQIKDGGGVHRSGTGLGLSIAEELVGLLGGELQLVSVQGKGSTFTCCLPLTEPSGAAAVAAAPLATLPSPVVDDRLILQPGDPHLLVVEDDLAFAGSFGDVIHDQGLRYVLATDAAQALRLARERRPSGIVLDVKLPDMDGFQLLEELRADPVTAGIPVHFASAVDAKARGLAMGAVGYVNKPVTREELVQVIHALVPSGPRRRVLVVENAAGADSLVTMLASENLQAHCVTSAHAALEAVNHERFGCMVLDLSLPDMDGLELLERMRASSGDNMPALLIYTARALSRAEARQLEAYADAIVLKEGGSTERLRDEIRLFARRLKGGAAPRRPTPVAAQVVHKTLGGRTILLVDDDMRTVYALSATLRAKGLRVITADTGLMAIELLEQNPDVDAVLMDIMMPEMDGYEAMRRIRQERRFAELPIVALTAKAMKGDRERCLDAGATDYLAKPIDADQLLSLLAVRLAGSLPSDEP